jgi:hypothetical protein
VGDLKLALSPKPLRKWSLLAPLGALSAALFKQAGHDELATAALMTAAAGQVATLTGFRQGQRPLEKTVDYRDKSWAIGLVLAGVVWVIAWFFSSKRR